MTTVFTMDRPRGFALRAAADFYADFTPGSGMAAMAADRLTLAFRLDGSFEAVAVALREQAGAIVGEVAGTRDVAAARAQVARLLGLDGDADAWHALRGRDPVVGALQDEFPGFFTAAKASPYEAAVWAILAARTSPAHAARVKSAIARELGDAVSVAGGEHHLFPAPAVLAAVDRLRGVSDEKVARLRGVARAALEERLDAGRLRAMGEEAALADLQTLRGIGPWSASDVYFRGAAPLDGLPTTEPRVLRGLASAYGLASPTMETLRRIAESWRPFRMWVCVLLARHLARVGGWHAPEIAEERADATRALGRRVRACARAAP